jgi:hypothetical protein
MKFKILSVLSFFILAAIAYNLVSNSPKTKQDSLGLYPIKQKTVQGHEGEVDSEGGDPLHLENIQISNYIKDVKGKDFSINKALGGMRDEAWCLHGEGIGECFKADIPQNQFIQRGKVNVYRIQVINGLATDKTLYLNSNRVKTIEIEFSEGEKRVLHLNDNDLDLQTFIINIKATWLKMTIREIFKGNKYNDLCVGKLFFETWTHPNDMTLIQRERHGYK